MGSEDPVPDQGRDLRYPYDYNLAWIYYRKDLYEKKGLSVPKTWAEMLKNSQALNEDGRSGSLFPIGSNGATNWLSPRLHVGRRRQAVRRQMERCDRQCR